MGHYTGVRLDIRLHLSTPQWVLDNITQAMAGEHHDRFWNGLFQNGGGADDWSDWDLGSLEQLDTHLLLRSNSATRRHIEPTIREFLSWLSPYILNTDKEIIAMSVYEETETYDNIYTLSRDKVLERRGDLYGYNTDHPKDWPSDKLALPLGLHEDYPNPSKTQSRNEV